MKFRSILAAVSGNFIEWYDFAIYLFLAPTIAKAFFPVEAGRFALLGTLTMHAISFFFRPLGAVVFGHLGDVLGRRVALQYSLALLTVLSIFIALLPTYHQIGWSAPLLLCLCRMGQGICLGGEFAGSMVYLTEISRINRRSLWSSMSNNGSNLGILAASGSAAFMSAWFSPTFFESYGYRILFLMGGLIGLIGFTLRAHLHETVAFETRGKSLSLPIAYLFKFEKKRIIQLFFLLGVSAVGSYGLIGSISLFLQQSLSLSMSAALIYETVFIALTLVIVPLCALVADKISPRTMLQRACIAYIFITLPSFYLFYQYQQPLFLLPIVLVYCMEQASTPAYMSTLFPAEYRYTAISFAYNVAMAIIGGISPLLGQLHVSNDNYSFSIAYLLMASSFIALPLIATLSNKDAREKNTCSAVMTI